MRICWSQSFDLDGGLELSASLRAYHDRIDSRIACSMALSMYIGRHIQRL
jgi:hypothetical protein